jgi:hypothetical protein
MGRGNYSVNTYSLATQTGGPASFAEGRIRVALRLQATLPGANLLKSRFLVVIKSHHGCMQPRNHINNSAPT